MPKTKEIKIWLHKSINCGHTTVFVYPEMDGYICLGSCVAVIDLVEQDETALVVDALNGQIQKEMADSEVRVEKIQDKIQQLLALSHDGEAK